MSGRARVIFSNTAVQIVGDIGAKALRLTAIILMARHLGSRRFGEFAFAVAFSEIVAIIADSRVDQIIIRRSASGSMPLTGLIGSAAWLKGLLAVAAVGVYGIVALVLNQPTPVTVNLGLGGITILCAAAINVAKIVFQLKMRLGFLAAGRMANAAVFFGAVILALSMKAGSSAWFMLAYVSGYIIEGILTVAWATRLLPLRLRWDGPLQMRIWREALPLAVINGLTLLYYRIDSVFLQVMRGSAAVGLYDAAYRFLDVSMFIPVALMTTVYPFLVKAHLEDAGNRIKLYRDAFNMLLVFSVPAAIAINMCSGELIAAFFGPAFVEAQALLAVVFLAIIPLYTAFAAADLLVSMHRQRDLLMTAILTAFVNVGLCLFLIPRAGAMGAAFATVATQMLVLCLYLWFVGKRTAISLDGRGLAAAAMAAVPVALAAFVPWPNRTLKLLAVGLACLVGIAGGSVWLFKSRLGKSVVSGDTE